MTNISNLQVKKNEVHKYRVASSPEDQAAELDVFNGRSRRSGFDVDSTLHQDESESIAAKIQRHRRC